MTKRKVLHIVPSLGIGGTEKTVQLIALHLNKNIFDVAVYSPTNGLRGPSLRAAGIPLIIREDVQNAIKAFGPDIVHLHRGGWPQPKLMAQVRGALRYAPDGSRVTRVLETNVFGHRDASMGGKIIDCSAFVSHFCAQRYGASHEVAVTLPRYTVVYNPIETAFLAAHSHSPQQREYSRPVVGRLSRPDAGKWSPLAMEMLPFLVQAVPDVRYAVVGAVDWARDYAREQGLQGHVEFLPQVEDREGLAAFLDSLSVFAHANATGESFGMVIAEAMAVGLPVVTHPCPLPKDNAQLELVEHGVTGLVAHTAEDYAAAVAWLLHHPEQARRMGQAGQDKAQALYAVEVITRQWEALYEYFCPLQEQQ